MTSPLRAPFRVAYVILAAGLALSLVALTVPNEVPVCVEARNWARDHRGSLPSTLRALSEYSLPYRRAIYAELPIETRRQLWSSQLTRFRDSTVLTVDQRALLTFLIENLDRYVDDPAAARAQHVRDSLDVRIARTFDRQSAYRVFGILGEPYELTILADSSESRVSAHPTCTCSQVSSYCFLYDCDGELEECLVVGGVRTLLVL